MRAMASGSVSVVITDPPYGLSDHDPADVAECLAAWLRGEEYHPRAKGGFMGRSWDAWVPGPEVWREAYRVMKPGAHLLAFAGSRTLDLMSMAIRLAGFEVRDTLQWLYGTGFPKSLNVSKAITKTLPIDKVREVKFWLAEQVRLSGKSKAQIDAACGFSACDYLKTEPGNDAGGRATWHLLLPLGERWVRMKEVIGFSEEYDALVAELGKIAGVEKASAAAGQIYGGYSQQVTTYALTDEARAWEGWGTTLKPSFEPIVLARKPLDATVAANVLEHGTGAINIDAARVPYIDAADLASAKPGGKVTSTRNAGTRPNVEREVRFDFDFKQSDLGRFPPNVVLDPEAAAQLDAQSPGTSRLFFCAKARTEERPVLADGYAHPTVKPLALMRWLVRLATPPGGLILDPFAGSGTTIEAAMLEGHRVLGIEADARSVELCRVRIARARSPRA